MRISSALENVRRMVALCRESCRRITETTTPRPIRSVGVVGAGIMGTAIAIEHAARFDPRRFDGQEPGSPAMRGGDGGRRVGGGQRCRGGVLAASNQLPTPWTMPILAAVTSCWNRSSRSGRPNRPSYAQIKPYLADRAILATNTSTIPVARLAAGLAAPGRFCGLHFCHPVRLRPLVEVIPGPATSPETVAAVVAHASSLGKLPLVVADGPGFVVNRLLLTYLNEA